MRFRSIARLSRDEHGSTLVEFALLAPAFLVMLFGVFQVGLLYQNYNAVRSLSSEAARYVMVEYQKNNDLTPQEIENAVFSMGQGGQFLLDDERLNVTVTTPTSRIVDVKEIGIQIDYVVYIRCTGLARLVGRAARGGHHVVRALPAARHGGRAADAGRPAHAVGALRVDR